MTNEEMNTTVAKTLLEFSQVQKGIACLKKRLEPSTQGLQALANQIHTHPESIMASAEGEDFRFSWLKMDMTGSTKFEHTPRELVDTLRELKDAAQRYHGLRQSLEQMGHGHMVKD